jgi:hypothetical protein
MLYCALLCGPFWYCLRQPWWRSARTRLSFASFRAHATGGSDDFEGQRGRVEEITFTYVVVRSWDDRRLVLPVSYFVERPFENWTMSTARILATVPAGRLHGLRAGDQEGASPHPRALVAVEQPHLGTSR